MPDEIVGSDVPSEFGRWLAETRQKKGLSPIQLAQKAGVSYPQVYNIESGRSQNPQERTREKLISALEERPTEQVVAATEKAAHIENVGDFIDFDPHDVASRPEDPGVYVFYDISDRPIYVGQTRNISNRIRSDHASRFWFRAPIVYGAAYVRIEDESLRKKIEKVMIKFLRSTAVINRQHVERDG